MIDRLVHTLGITSVRELLVYLGLAWLVLFLGFLVILYTIIYIGIPIDPLPLLGIAFILSLLGAVASLSIPYFRKKEDIESNFPFFLVFMGSMATAKTNYEEFFKTLAETKEYGEISKEMNRLYHLATDWKLGYAGACKVVSDTTPSPLFSSFLARLSQVVEFGEDIQFFFRSLFNDMKRDIQTQYQESVYKITTIAELFSALFVASSFVLAFMAMMPIFVPVSEDIIMLSFYAIVFVIDLVVIVMVRTTLPPDKLANDPPNISKEHLASLIALFTGMVVSLIVFAISWFAGLDPILQVGLSALPLIYAGYISRKAENLIRLREKTYVYFIRTLGELVSIREGAVLPVVKRLRRQNYPGLMEALQNLYRRLSITRDVFRSFKLFSKELGSAILTKFNELFIKVLYAGADPKTVGEIIGDQLHTILDARKLRLQTAAGARGIIYGTYWGVALGVFLAIKSLAAVFVMFQSVLSGLEFETTEFLVAPLFNFNIDLRPAIDHLVYVFALEAVFLSYVIKMLDGGLRSNASQHFVIMIIGLVIVYYITDIALSVLLPLESGVEVTTR